MQPASRAWARLGWTPGDLSRQPSSSGVMSVFAVCVSLLKKRRLGSSDEQERTTRAVSQHHPLSTSSRAKGESPFFFLSTVRCPSSPCCRRRHTRAHAVPQPACCNSAVNSSCAKPRRPPGPGVRDVVDPTATMGTGGRSPEEHRAPGMCHRGGLVCETLQPERHRTSVPANTTQKKKKVMGVSRAQASGDAVTSQVI